MCARERKSEIKKRKFGITNLAVAPRLGALSSGVIRNGENLHSEQVNAILMAK